MRLILSNSYGTPNIGDDAILTAMVDELVANDHQVEILTFEPDVTGGRYPSAKAIRSGVFAGTCKTFLAIRKADVLVIGGGGILQDGTSLGNLLFHLSRAAMAIVCRTPFVLAGVGVGPIHSRFGGWLLAIAVRRAAHVSLRDEKSSQLLGGLGLDSNSFSVDADLAHLLHSNSRASRDRPKRFTVGLSVRPPIGSRRQREAMTSAFERQLSPYVATIDKMSKQNDIDFVFVSMNPEQDDAVGRAIQKSIADSGALRLISGNATPREIIGELRNFDLMVGMRLHTLILATGQGVPVIALNYDDKVKSFMTRIGMRGQSLDLEDVKAESLALLIGESLLQREALRAQLDVEIPKQVALARRAMTAIQQPL